MTKPITRVISHAIHATAQTVAGHVESAANWIRGLRERHADLMRDRAAYRAQLAAAAAAIVALIELPHTWATLVLALVAIYIATFTPNEGGWFRSTLSVADDDPYDRW